MAIPAILTFLPKLLPAAKLAYDHRDKAVTLYKNIQNWRKKEPKLEQPENIAPLSTEEQIEKLQEMIYQRDDIIAEQSEILAKLATDVTELTTLTDKLRRRSVWLWRFIYIALLLFLFRWIFL